MEATASYSAVPSIVTMAPTGATKRVTRLSILRLSSRQRMVIGRVAELGWGDKKQNRSELYNTFQWLPSHYLNFSSLLCLLLFQARRIFSNLPGWSPKGGGERFVETRYKLERILLCENQIDEGQSDNAVDCQAGHYSENIHGKLMSHKADVCQLQEPSCNQEEDSYWRIPVRESRNREGDAKLQLIG